MSDLEPLLSVPQSADPYVARVLVRALRTEADFRAMGALGTSCSMIAIDDASNVIRQLEVEQDVILDRVRSELILMTDSAGPEARGSIRERNRRTIRPRRLGKPEGSFACVLGEAIDRSSNEFVVVAGTGDNPLTGLSAALGHMWVEGADIAVLGTNASTIPPGIADTDVAPVVPAWLGLTAGGGSRETVVMRRWFARWIFNEIDRSLDPAEEIADRVRLLGVTIVYADSGQRAG